MLSKLNYRIILCLLICGLVGFNLVQAAPSLFAYLLTALGLGLRHGLDADHIVIIDNITRKLAHQKKPSSTTGLFFAAGHSTIVFIMTLAIVLGLNHTSGYFEKITQFGNSFGALVSITFLAITLILNLLMIQSIKQSDGTSGQIRRGLSYRIYSRYILNAIDSPYKMYFVGFLFGLGFDTATEIGLLALAATSLFQGVSGYLILLLPVAFACGMVMTDTANSTFMSRIYTQVQNNQQKLKLYNYIILGFASLVTLLVILIELVGYLKDQFAIHTPSLIMIGKLDDNSELIGSSIACVFMVLGLIVYSILLNNRKA